MHKSKTMKDFFEITTNLQGAKSIEKEFNSITMQNRSIKLGRVSHYDGFSTVQIIPKYDGKQIDKKDVFWLGFYSSLNEIKIM